MNEGKEKLSLEEYKRICDKGYIFEDRVQPVIFRTKVAANETINYSLKRIIEKLLEKGLLEPLSDIQRKSVFSIICLTEYE